MDVCTCDVTLGNTGKPGCKRSYLVAKYLIFTALIGSNGLANTVDITNGEPDSTFINTGLNAANGDDRLYPLGEFEEVTNERAEAIFQEFDSGKKVKVRDGFKTFTGFVPNAEPLLIDKVKQAGCGSFGAYIVDAGGNFIFSARKSDGVILTGYPIEIDTATIDVKYREATDTTIGGLMITFQWSSNESDGYLRQVKAADMDWNASDLDGLLDVNSIVASPSNSTDISIQLVDDYGDDVVGVVAGDMALANLTTPGAVAIDSVTENPDGTYLIDYTTAAVGSGQELELTITKDGYDWSRVKSNTWTTV